mmetsp:Transcript_3553/g.14244  ORF Transcript_3553/g.14244 Transcript_3553/m.14244 type:complete len:1711 (-) Transcript_3553:38-5170(-)
MDRPSPLSPSPQRRATGGEIEHASPHTPARQEDSGGHLSIKGLDSLDLTRSPRNSTRDEDRDHSSPVELTRSRENSVHGPSGGGGPGFMSPEAQLALYPMFFCEERHEQSDVGTEPPGGSEEVVSKWRMRDRMKTTSVALILCLNIGVDPPDVLKISPCARMQCWINPLAMQAQKALDCIGKALQAQYERWQPRAKYRLQLDPTVEDVKKLCASCRRNAKNERVLLHYNGHGVPRPTVNGEVWVFNKSYTQYIPLSVYDLQAWVGKPAIYVFDCSGAGVVVNTFLQLAQHGNLGSLGTPSAGPDARGTNGGGSATGPNWTTASAGSAAISGGKNGGAEGGTLGGIMPLGAGGQETILLAACGADELLPQSAELPADVFSSCLTTPIKIALRWFCQRSILRGDGISMDLIDKIPGQENNRKTPLGELNWIFTAITDTIAWNVLPQPLFQRLFRQDLLVASLFRNFLLAERIMRANNCTPISCPALPPTYQHPMWHAWDMAVEICLLQLPSLVAGDPNVEFAPSPFFTEQLTAFEVWLEHGSERKPPPEQLPIVLQVLLSQSHRLRALVLLGRFLDMGPWAVDLALSVGIFPYVLKLLQTTAPDLRQILVFIWTKILALDRSCQLDLVKDNGHVYFIRFLDSPQVPSEERAMAAFVLAAITDGHPKGQTVCAQSGLMQICLGHLPHAASPAGSPLFVRWLCLCVGKLWENFKSLQGEAFASGAAEAIAPLLAHPIPDVRAAAVYALGALIYVPPARVNGSDGLDDEIREEAGNEDDDRSSQGKGAKEMSNELDRAAAERTIACQILPGISDASPPVRVETAVALGRLACVHSMLFRSAAAWWRRGGSPRPSSQGGFSSDGAHPSSPGLSSRSHTHGGGALGDHHAGSGSFDSGRNAGVHAASPEGPYEPAFGTLGYRDPSVDNLAAAGNAQGPGSPPHPHGGTNNTTFASADAARVGGGLYVHLLEQLVELAQDPSPRVAGVARKALTATGIEPTHPLLRPVLRSLPFAAGSTGRGGGGADGSVDGYVSEASARGDAGVGSPARGAREESGTGTPLGGRGRTASWHQKLSSAAARLLGSPRGSGGSSGLFSPSPSASALAGTPPASAHSRLAPNTPGTADAGLAGPMSGVPPSRTRSHSSLGSGAVGGGRGGVHGRNAAERAAERTMRNGGMRRTTTVSGELGSPPMEQPSFPPAFADPPESPVHRGGTGAGPGGKEPDGDVHAPLRAVLPKSHIFAWSCEHFSRSLLEPANGHAGYDHDDDDFFPQSFGGHRREPKNLHRRLDPSKRLARRRIEEENMRRSGRARKETLKLTEHLASIDMDESAAPACMLMHPIAPTAAIADDRGVVRVWDYQSGAVLNRFSAGMPGRSVASLSLVNDLDDALLMTGGADGSVRVWRNYALQGEETLVTALRALPLPSPAHQPRHRDDATEAGGGVAVPGSDVESHSRPGSVSSTASEAPPRGKPPSHRRTSFGDQFKSGGSWKNKGVVSWQQQSGCLYASGDTQPVPLLRVWDMTRELCLESLQMQSPGTCLMAEGALLMAGAADGAVLSFDLRTPARLLSVVQTHQHPVVSILLQPGQTSNLVVTGSVNGEMKFCDLRNAAKPFYTTEVQRPSAGPGGGRPTLTALVAHKYAPVIASGSSERAIKLWDLEGNNVASIRYYNSFLGQRIGAVRSLAFHPNSLLLAAGSNDSIATVYSGEMSGAGAGSHRR